MTSYPALNLAYLRLTNECPCPAMIDYLRPLDRRSATEFDHLCAALELILSTGDKPDVSRVIKALGNMIDVPEYQWVATYDWSE